MADNGIAIGIVDNLEDDEHLGRIRVKYPHLDDQKSRWARLVTPMAGQDRGLFFRPEKEDEVLVCFLHGDPNFPYILGSLWNTRDKPPQDDGNATANNWRFFKSRSGHLLKFDDTDGSEKIEIIGKGENHKIIIDVAADKIQIICKSGDLELKTKGSIKVDAEANIALTAKGDMTLRSDGTMTIKGQTVKIN
jgi:uncharacterized protein involved in type VI secretion and phage assembly